MGMTLQLLDTAGDQFMHDLLWLTVIIVSIAGALMTLYAVYIGYLFFTATDANRRKAAKDRAIKVVASTLIVFALVFVLQGIEVSFATDFVQEKSNNSAPSTTNIKYQYSYPSVSLNISGDVNDKDGLHGDFQIEGNAIQCEKEPNVYSDIEIVLGGKIKYIGFQVSGFNYKSASTNNDASARWSEDLSFEVNKDKSSNLDFHFRDRTGHVPCCIEKGTPVSRYVNLKVFFRMEIENKSDYIGMTFSIDVKLNIYPAYDSKKWFPENDLWWN